MLTAVFVLLLLFVVVLPVLGWTVVTAVSAAVVGLVIGGLGRLVAPGRHRLGLLVTMVVGLAGSLVGSGVGRAVGTGDLGTLLLQIAAAAIGVALLSGRR